MLQCCSNVLCSLNALVGAGTHGYLFLVTLSAPRERERKKERKKKARAGVCSRARALRENRIQHVKDRARRRFSRVFSPIVATTATGCCATAPACACARARVRARDLRVTALFRGYYALAKRGPVARTWSWQLARSLRLTFCIRHPWIGESRFKWKARVPFDSLVFFFLH